MSPPNPPSQRPRTLADIARITLAGEEESIAARIEAFSFALRNFLDFFYAAAEPERAALLAEEPSFLRVALGDGGVADAYLAALSNHLSRQYGLKRPEWSDVPGRLPDQPWFALNSPKARIWLLTQSPGAFRERDLFISEDALTRA